MTTSEYIAELTRELQDALRQKRHYDEQADKAHRRALMLQAKIDGAK